MAKKILVIFLSVLMTCATIIPAFAAEPAEDSAAEEISAENPENGSVTPDIPEEENIIAPEEAEAPEITDTEETPDMIPEENRKITAEEPASTEVKAEELRTITPEITSFTLNDAGFRRVHVSWTCKNCDRASIVWSEKSDFSNGTANTYSGTSADLSVPAWKTIYVKIIPMNGEETGQPQTASIGPANDYRPAKLKTADSAGTLYGGTNELDIRVLDRKNREVPKKYYRLVRASNEGIGPNKGYVTFVDDYSDCAKMTFSYTANPPKPVSFRVVPFSKDSVYFRAGMNYISKRYDYCEIVYANNKQFKNWKAVKIASKSDPKVLAKGLKPNTTYYARAKYVKKVSGKIYKSDYVPLTFKTAGNPPWPTSASATTKSLLASMKKNRSFTFTLPQKLSPQDAEEYMWMVLENHPQYDKFNYCCLYDSDGYLIEKITFTYNKTKAARAAKLKAKIDSITKYARKKGCYKNQVSYVNWRMKKMCSYDWSAYYCDDWRKHPEAYTAYGCLVKGKSVCEGYSLAFNAIMLELGIPTKRMSGRDHAWNIVKIGNKWYHVDVTWNDTTNSNRYLLTRSHE